MLSILEALLIFLAVFLSAYLYGAVQSRRRVGSAKALPGPKGKPFVGNLPDIPKKHSWLKFKEWGDQYGPVYGLNIAGTTHVILSTESAATDLLVKRGLFYSGRGGLTALSEGLTQNHTIVLQPPNELWRKQRRVGKDLMNPSAVSNYASAQYLESATTVLDLLESPTDYERHIERFTSGVIFRVGMGKRVLTGNENYVRLAFETVHNIDKVGSPGANLCDAFPILWKLPSWMYPFKRQLYKMHEVEDRFFREMQEGIAERLRQGTAVDCWQKRYLESKTEYDMTDKQGRWALGGLLAAGMPTTASALLSFLLAMVLHPDWQRKMQQEIDFVVGDDRLPEHDDMTQLPTVRAALKETLRWRPVAAGGIPHMLEKDDTYLGYFMPKGSLVHANQWAIHHDSEQYPDPGNFRPERWLDPSFPTYQEPLTIYPNVQGFSAFGFGRRICPGLNMAERSMNLLAARLIWASRISKKINPQTGKEIDVPRYHYTAGRLNARPMPFDFELQPRDEKRLDLLRKVVNIGKLEDPLRNKEEFGP